MSGSHEKLPWLFWAQLVLVAIVGILYFVLGSSGGGHGDAQSGHDVSEASKKALKPIGEVAVSNGSGASSEGSERSGKDIVNKTCQSCHANGVANAPRLDESAKAVWEERLTKGIDGMLETAKTGKGAMPPMGTDPTLSDSELKGAIIYMLGKAGVDTSSLVSGEKVAENPAVTENKSVEDVVTSKKAEMEEASTAAMPSAQGSEVNNSSSDSEGAELSAPMAPSAPEPPAPDDVSVETAPAAVAAATPSAESSMKSSIDAAKLYSTTCFACHDTGAAGAPKVGDTAAWKERIATGQEALYESAIKGKTTPTGVMPPKGGYMNLTDDEVKAIVDFMVSKSQ